MRHEKLLLVYMSEIYTTRHERLLVYMSEIYSMGHERLLVYMAEIYTTLKTVSVYVRDIYYGT